MEVKVKLIDLASLPHYASVGDSGADLYCTVSVTLEPGERRIVPTGVCLEIPDGYEAQVRPRSGMSARGLDVAFGTIDSGYRGEVGVIVCNNRRTPFDLNIGARIAQLVIAPVVRAKFVSVDSLSRTDRGAGGFGSTGQ